MLMRSQQPAHRRRSLSVAVARLSAQGPRLRVLHPARCSGAVLPRSRAPRSAGSTDPLQQSHAVAYTVRRCCCSPRVHKCCLARSSSCLSALTLRSEVDSEPHLTLSGGCRSAAGLLATQHLSDAAAWAAAQLAIASSLHCRSLAYRQSKRKGVAVVLIACLAPAQAQRGGQGQIPASTIMVSCSLWSLYREAGSAGRRRDSDPPGPIRSTSCRA